MVPPVLNKPDWQSVIIQNICFYGLFWIGKNNIFLATPFWVLPSYSISPAVITEPSAF
jgi:hypothetical protein